MNLGLEALDLRLPPPEVVEQGVDAIKAFLRDNADSQHWISKLLVVGEGGVGKTSVLRALRGDPFVKGLETTHGVQLGTIELRHPEQPLSMTLNCWDFGGQEIYHATHQFFLTNRSLFLLVWNARVGYGQSKLYYWLETIRSLAPDSPIVIVATYQDERAATLPIHDIKARFPRVVHHCSVSNLTGAGIADLSEELRRRAADLPLMGQNWPSAWLAAANATRALDATHIEWQALRKLFAEKGVEDAKSQSVLAKWLHELGDILYFSDDDELGDVVLLNPQWVTERISKVLEYPRILEGLGIFRHEHMDEVWSDVELTLRERLLRLMERFDLSYRIPEDPEDKSIVVERVQLNPPEYESDWQRLYPAGDDHSTRREISMRFDLESSRPAGVTTWFIAREHRFTLNKHWRYGAMFGDDRRNWKRLALIDAPPSKDYVDLTVRGPTPHGFFTLLRDGFERILDRFKGLKFVRRIRCQCTPGCEYWFDYDQLLKWQERDPPIETAQCQKNGQQASVSKILFGVHTTTSHDPSIPHLESKLLERLGELEDQIVGGFADQEELLRSEFSSLAELVHRGFLHQFHREQRLTESHCPRVFTLRPLDASTWPGKVKELLATKWELQLYCEAPSYWHPLQTGRGGTYTIETPMKWVETLAPWINGMVKLLKFATPIVGPWLRMTEPHYEALLKDRVALMKGLAGNLTELEVGHRETDLERRVRPGEVSGDSLRGLRSLLEELDPRQKWGGLKKVLTPEGHYLWLCSHHEQEYLPPKRART